MSKKGLYDGTRCPCPSDCSRHGKCSDCIRFHHGRHQQTYCEFLLTKLKGPEAPERSLPTGLQIRLTDYGPCAG